MSDLGEILEDGALRFVRMVPGPIERVWAYLTEPDLRAQWLCGGETARAPGGRIVMAFDNSRLTPHQDDLPPEKYKDSGGPVTFEGEVVAYQPPHVLSFTWPDKDGRSGLVTFRLREEDGRVRLELTHEGVTRADDLIGASGGWHVHLTILADKMDGRAPAPFWAAHAKAEAVYEQRFAAALERLRRDP